MESKSQPRLREKSWDELRNGTHGWTFGRGIAVLHPSFIAQSGQLNLSTWLRNPILNFLAVLASWRFDLELFGEQTRLC